ncbi:LPXTG-motif cell wall-anchored protein [Microbacterium ginsengiterrae]|uniref:Aminopeptidase N n=1 Tax=Microbacterium ginsengiterrae TaxID=546115 RepID=A0A7W9FB63_9MICO|nr:M1 family aminopeptidase [Microbacterium ginsengiterrae]MBB5742842.1 LPXTG-motif cell wall-anchored protein [Microbacterium ginsengiterrae]
MTRLPSSPRRRLLATSLVSTLVAGALLATAAPAVAHGDPIDGPQTAGDAVFPNVGNGGYDALDYDIDIAWSPTGVAGGVITGEFDAASMTMTARALTPLRSFSLDFEGLNIDSVFVDGQPATWTRIVEPTAIKYKLVITPATPVEDEFTVTVNYSGVPQHHIDADGSQEGWSGTNDGAMLLGQPIGMMTAFPHNNTPGDKATYTITVDAPSVLADVNGVEGPGAVASNGELVMKESSAGTGRTTWTWRQDEQMASELVVIGIGRYEVVEGSITLTDGRVIPSWSFIDSGLTTSDKNRVRDRIALLEPMTQNLESIYGPYPGNSTGVIVKTVPRAINYALETQDRSFFPSVNSVAGNTLIHELAHQWYGNNVAPSTWTDIWMGEGMASWAPTYYNSAEGFGTSATTVEESYFSTWNRTAATSGNWAIAPGAQTDSADLYGYQTYTRSGMFWSVLRVAMGDEAFFALIEQWQIDNAGQSRSGSDLLALATEISGRDLDALWTDWILEPGKPAWPDKSLFALTSDASAPLNVGESVQFDLTAENTGRVALASTSVSVDVAQLLESAVLDVPAEATLDGTTLTWVVPQTAVGATATLSFTATITESAPGGTVAATASSTSPGASCADCVAELDVVEKVLPSQAPAISGDAVVGETLTVSSEGWPEGTSLSYEWALDGVVVDPADGNSVQRAARPAGSDTFVIPADAVGARVSVTVTGSLDGYRDGSVTSESTVAVREASDSTPGGGTGGTPADGAGSGSDSGSGTSTPDELSQTGAELPTAAALLGFMMLVAGGLFAAARRRRRIDAEV